MKENEILQHVGVLGMHWGRRKGSKTTGKDSSYNQMKKWNDAQKISGAINKYKNEVERQAIKALPKNERPRFTSKLITNREYNANISVNAHKSADKLATNRLAKAVIKTSIGLDGGSFSTKNAEKLAKKYKVSADIIRKYEKARVSGKLTKDLKVTRDKEALKVAAQLGAAIAGASIGLR